MRSFVLAAATALFGTVAGAATVDYTLSTTTFTNPDFSTGLPTVMNGGTVSGSFTFDSTTGTYSNISLTTTAGAGYSAESYDSTAPGWTTATAPANSATIFVNSAGPADLTGQQALLPFIFNYPASQFGDVGTFVIDVYEGTCSNATCSQVDAFGIATAPRYVFDAEITGVMAPVPLPAGLPLLAGALGLLAFARRRKS